MGYRIVIVWFVKQLIWFFNSQTKSRLSSPSPPIWISYIRKWQIFKYSRFFCFMSTKMSENWSGSKNVRKFTRVQNVRYFPWCQYFKIFEENLEFRKSQKHRNQRARENFLAFFTWAKSFSDIFTRNHISDGPFSLRVKVKSKIIIKAVFKSIFLFIVVLPRGTPPNPTWFLNISSRIICKRIISIESLSKVVWICGLKLMK